jgi:hypothetical protein
MRRVPMTKLTEEQRVIYLIDKPGQLCPFCRTEGATCDYDRGGFNLTGGMFLEIPSECPTCGEEWTDIFKLHDVEAK